MNNTIDLVDEKLKKISSVLDFMIDVTNIFVRTGLECDETFELLKKIQVTEDWMDNLFWHVGGFEYKEGVKFYMKLECCKDVDNCMYYVQNSVMNVIEFLKDVCENYTKLALANEPMDDAERLEFAAWHEMLMKSEKMVEAVHDVEDELGKYFDFSWEREI